MREPSPPLSPDEEGGQDRRGHSLDVPTGIWSRIGTECSRRFREQNRERMSSQV